jgi:hypothetical protein
MTRLQNTISDDLLDIDDEGYTLSRVNRERRKAPLPRVRDEEHEPKAHKPKRLRAALED